MRLHGRCALRQAVAGGLRWLIPAVLAGVLAGGCESPFEAFEENTAGPFSVFGHLDLRADTQWIRVMPVRQNLLLEPKPIDAVVTLEHLASGRSVTLKDSLFRFADPRLESEGYVYNFWTTERLEPGASYRLRAVRSDGASTMATVVMPADLELTLLYSEALVDSGLADVGRVRVRAEHVLYTDVIYEIWHTVEEKPAEPIVRRERRDSSDIAGTQYLRVLQDSLRFPHSLPVRALRDMRRLELRLAVARSDWPFAPGLSHAEIALPGNAPSNIENGIGFVGAVATWTVPLQRCHASTARPDGEQTCTTVLNAHTASVVGSVVREPCSVPSVQAKIRLSQRFAGGGSVLFEWQAGWEGEYRFEGIEPGAELVLDFGPGTPPMHLPRLAPGDRHVVPPVSLRVGC
jgi:hypothetical protein